MSEKQKKHSRSVTSQQHGSRWCTKICHWKTAVGTEHRCTPGQQNVQVWPWTVADWLALAQCGRSSLVQACRYSPPVSPQQGTEVPDRLLCHCLGLLIISDCAQHTIASWMYRAIDELHSAVGHSLSLDQPSGIRFQSSSEMSLRTLSSSHWKHCFSDNISVLSVLVVSTTMRYRNWRFTYLLTYTTVHRDIIHSLLTIHISYLFSLHPLSLANQFKK